MTARQLTELLVALDKTVGPINLAVVSAQANSLIQQAQTSARQMIDCVFWRVVLLVAAILAAALVYSYLKPLRRTGLSADQAKSG